MKKLFTLVLTVAISFSMLYAQKHLQKAPNLPPKLDVHSPAFSTGDTVVVSDLYYVINTEKKTAKLTYQDKTSHNYEGLSSIVNILITSPIPLQASANGHLHFVRH